MGKIDKIERENGTLKAVKAETLVLVSEASNSGKISEPLQAIHGLVKMHVDQLPQRLRVVRLTVINVCRTLNWGQSSPPVGVARTTRIPNKEGFFSAKLNDIYTGVHHAVG